MEIKEFLSLAQVTVDLSVPDKPRLLGELARRAGAVVHVAPEQLLSALIKREELGSTGTGGGVAIPHARLSAIDKPFGMLARLSQPIEFNAIDGKPVDIVFLLLIPEDPKNKQLKVLACAARMLRDPDVVGSIRLADDSLDAYRVVTASGKA